MNLKAQGTTEYLIILAIVIVIALVVVGVLGGFPKIGGNINEAQSKTYWASIQPIGIIDWKMVSSGSSTFVFQNNSSTNNLQVTELSLNGTAMSIADTNINAGAKASLSGTGVNCTGGSTYSYNAVITYNTPDISAKTFTGSVPIVGTC